mgnify:CR=1 FL=1
MRRLRRYFLTGLAVILPSVVTIYVLWFLFIKLDGILGALIRERLGISLPGIGLAAIFIILLAAGFMASNLLGRRLINLLQRIMENIPLFNRMYIAIRQISEALLSEDSKVFRRVAPVSYTHLTLPTKA